MGLCAYGKLGALNQPEGFVVTHCPPKSLHPMDWIIAWYYVEVAVLKKSDTCAPWSVLESVLVV